jgi:Protein of unknown function (DUF4242)
MDFVVERYLPGLDRDALDRALKRLQEATEDMQREGTRIRYLGSTVVPQDEACFCQFEADSENAVVEANRRAEIPAHRIVAAVAVTRHKRRRHHP